MVAAVSVGIVDGQLLCDLEYVEDSQPETDMNVVMIDDGRMIEVQVRQKVHHLVMKSYLFYSCPCERGLERYLKRKRGAEAINLFFKATEKSLFLCLKICH